MNNFPTAENIWFVEAHTCFQLFNFVCLAAISLKVSAKLTRNKFKNITASYLLTSYLISSVKMLRMSNPVLFTMDWSQNLIFSRWDRSQTMIRTSHFQLNLEKFFCDFLGQKWFQKFSPNLDWKVMAFWTQKIVFKMSYRCFPLGGASDAPPPNRVNGDSNVL